MKELKMDKNRNMETFHICSFFCWVFDHQTWMVYERYPPAWKAKESSAIFFSENELPTAESSYALCKVSIYNLYALQNLLQFRVLIDVIVGRQRGRVVQILHPAAICICSR